MYTQKDSILVGYDTSSLYPKTKYHTCFTTQHKGRKSGVNTVIGNDTVGSCLYSCALSYTTATNAEYNCTALCMNRSMSYSSPTAIISTRPELTEAPRTRMAPTPTPDGIVFAQSTSIFTTQYTPQGSSTRSGWLLTWEGAMGARGSPQSTTGANEPTS